MITILKLPDKSVQNVVEVFLPSKFSLVNKTKLSLFPEQYSTPDSAMSTQFTTLLVCPLTSEYYPVKHRYANDLCIALKIITLYVMQWGEKKKTETRRTTKSKRSCLIFKTFTSISENLGVSLHVYNRIVKDFSCRGFAFLFCGYYGAEFTSLPYIPGGLFEAILSLLKKYYCIYVLYFLITHNNAPLTMTN